MTRYVLIGLLATACATPTKPRTEPRSSPDRCMVITAALCTKMVSCTDKSQVSEGECQAMLEASCEDAAGITNQEMLDCTAAIVGAACTDPLPEACKGIASSATAESTPGKGEVRCER